MSSSWWPPSGWISSLTVVWSMVWYFIESTFVLCISRLVEWKFMPVLFAKGALFIGSIVEIGWFTVLRLALKL